MISLLHFLLVFHAAAHAGVTVSFVRQVGNIEHNRSFMQASPPPGLVGSPAVKGEAWYGQISRRLPEDVASLNSDRFVPFMAEYRQGVATRVWCDTDLDGRLDDENPLSLARHPSGDEARSVLVDLRWSASLAARQTPIDWKLRIVLEPERPGAPGPASRVQSVFAMMGTVVLEGKRHHAFLLDGDRDGLYTRGLMDGVFVDLDDDGNIEVDQMSPEFGSFSVPFSWGGTKYEVVEVDPEGRSLTMRTLGPGDEPQPPPAIGQPAPDFSFTDTSGHLVSLSRLRGRHVLVYFWSSWCGTCEGQAEGLRRIYERGAPAMLEILGISYDTDRAAMESFRRRHAQTWPTSFSGRKVWEDPVGRLYRERGSGAMYLVNPEGRLEGIYTSVPELESRLEEVLGK
ncbi:MAG: peroxiredoxin family protein [Candidatus Polarisedimenticolia bacterium]